MATRFLEGATAEENHQRFVRRAVEHEKVWTLAEGERILTAQSTAGDEDDAAGDAEPRAVYLFFSDEAYARRAVRESWADRPDAAPKEIALFDLLFRWLPGMHHNDQLAGTNWTGDLIGLEIEPADLQAELKQALSEETRARYQSRFAEVTRS